MVVPTPNSRNSAVGLASGSASTARTRHPSFAINRASAAAKVDFPVPPLPEMASFIGYKLPGTPGLVGSAQVLESSAQAFGRLKRGLIFEREDAAVTGLLNLANHRRVVSFAEPQLVAAWMASGVEMLYHIYVSADMPAEVAFRDLHVVAVEQ